MPKFGAKITGSDGKVDSASGKGLSSNDFTTAYKTKLDGIAENVNNYTHPTSAGNKHIPSGGSSGNILLWDSAGTAKWGSVTKSTIGLGNVANYDQSKAIKSITRSGTTFTYTCLDNTTGTFTQQDNNTTYSVATTSANGLMSSGDKSKLNGISSGATVNIAFTTLYDNGSGSNGNITLSASAANYSYMIIFIRDENGRNYKGISVYSPNGKTVNLNIVESWQDGDYYMNSRSRRVTISGTSISTDCYGYLLLHNNGVNQNNSNYVYITKVIAW